MEGNQTVASVQKIRSQTMDPANEDTSLGDVGVEVEVANGAEKKAGGNVVHEAEVDLPAKEVFLTSSLFLFSCILLSPIPKTTIYD